MATKVTLRALWKVADDRLVENEYFAKIAQDYRAHTEWIEEGEARLRGLEGRKNPSSVLPSIRWLQISAREGLGEVGFVPVQEKGRWGERMRAIMEFWRPLIDSGVDRNENYRALRGVLDPLLDVSVNDRASAAKRRRNADYPDVQATGNRLEAGTLVLRYSTGIV